MDERIAELFKRQAIVWEFDSLFENSNPLLEKYDCKFPEILATACNHHLQFPFEPALPFLYN